MSLRSSCFYSKSSQTMQMGLKSVSCPRAVLSPSQIQDYIISTRKVDDEEGGETREKGGDQREEKTLILLHRRRWLLQIRLVITHNISGAFACLQSCRGDRFGRLLKPFITVFISLDACNKCHLVTGERRGCDPQVLIVAMFLEHAVSKSVLHLAVLDTGTTWVWQLVIPLDLYGS